MLTLPWYWKSVNVTDPAVRTEAALEAVMAEGAAACFSAAFLPLAAAPLVDVPLGDGEALADVEGVGVAEGEAVPDWPTEGVGDGLAGADGEDDADGVGVGAEPEGVGVGDADGRQMMPRMQLSSGCVDAALAAPLVPSMPGHQEGRHRGDRQRPVPPGRVADVKAAAIRSRSGLLRDRRGAFPFRARLGDQAEAGGRFPAPAVPVPRRASSPSRSAGASSSARPAGSASTDPGSAGTQANASAPPMIASSMPRTNPPRLDAGNEMMPSTIPAIP